MINLNTKSDCCGCGACAAVCPRQCIEMKQDEEGFYYPQVNKDQCIDCGLCERTCPFVKIPLQADLLATYAAKSNTLDIRKTSSSGGMFHHLCESILNDGGLVVGVAMDETCRTARHLIIDDIVKLPQLRGSKYLQTDPLTVYRQVKQHLTEGKPVLFSGTPCQVNALANYLNKPYDNLYCVDTICHGVPSPALWDAYLDSIEQKIGRVTFVSFRHKGRGRKDEQLPKTGKTYYSPKSADPYMQMFLKNYSLRPSCYSCRAKTNRASDLTLADFWGLNQKDITDDGYGVSLVLIRTEKGRRLFERISADITCVPADPGPALKRNYMEYKSAARPAERDSFYRDFRELGFQRLAQKYVKVNQYAELKRNVKRFLQGGSKTSSDYGLLFTSSPDQKQQ